MSVAAREKQASNERITHWQKILGCGKITSLDKYVIETGVSITDPKKAEAVKREFMDSSNSV